MTSNMKAILLGAAAACALSLPAVAQDSGNMSGSDSMSSDSMPSEGTSGDSMSGDSMSGESTSGDSMSSDSMAGGMEGEFTVSEEVMFEDGTLTVESLTSPQDGFLVVHEMEDGTFGDPIGHVAITEGENTDLEVELMGDVASGDPLTAMLHEDSGEEGTFEYPETEGVDGPVMDGDTPVMQEVTVQ